VIASDLAAQGVLLSVQAQQQEVIEQAVQSQESLHLPRLRLGLLYRPFRFQDGQLTAQVGQGFGFILKRLASVLVQSAYESEASRTCGQNDQAALLWAAF